MITLSKTFITCDVRLIGLYCFGSSFEPPLWIGAIICSLCIFGIVFSSILFLSIVDKGSTTEFFVLFKSIAGIPSGPAADFSLRSVIASIRSLSLLYSLDHLLLCYQTFHHQIYIPQYYSLLNYTDQPTFHI